jgi:hypothetical protein
MDPNLASDFSQPVKPERFSTRRSSDELYSSLNCLAEY